jgi:hypothetical protein
MTRVWGAAAAGILLAGILACGDRPGRGDTGGGEASTAQPPPPVEADTTRPSARLPAGARIPPGLVVRAVARVERDSLSARLIVTNTSADSVPLSHGACALVVRAYRAEGAGAVPAWRSDRPSPPAVIGCPAVAFYPVLAPHQEYSPKELRTGIPTDSILGDSLRAGAYRIGVVSHLGPDPVELDAGILPLRRSSGSGPVNP